MRFNCNNGNIDWINQRSLNTNALFKFQEEQNFVKRPVFKRATRQNKTIHVCTCSGPNKNMKYWSFQVNQKNSRIQINSAVSRWHSTVHIFQQLLHRSYFRVWRCTDIWAIFTRIMISFEAKSVEKVINPVTGSRDKNGPERWKFKKN